MKCLYPANIWLKGAGPRRGGVPGNLFWAPVFYDTLGMILMCINK